VSRHRTVLVVAAIMAVLAIAACTRQATPKAATAGAASAGTSAARPIAASPATPAPAGNPATGGNPATPERPAVTHTPAATHDPSVPPDHPATPASTALPAQARPSGTRYTNARFGFSFTVPPGYRAQSPPADGDGLSFASPARTATVTAYGASNIGRYSPAQELARLVTTHQSARDTVSYRFSGQDVIAVSGTTPGGTVFYQREVVYSAVIYTLVWSYPAATKAQYGTLVTQTVDSFVPGPDHTG
jgi:hypothetical protein